MKIFITGASRGIGYKTMMMALERGNDVAFTYNNPATDLQKIYDEAKRIAPNQMCKGYQLNVKYNDQVMDVVDAVLDDFDSIDTVINNAGIKGKQTVLGPGAFVRIYPVKFLFVQGQFEQNYVNYKFIDPNAPSVKYKFKPSSILVGAGYCQGRENSDDLFYYVSLMFDITKDKYSPYVQVNTIGGVYAVPIFRAGLQIPLFSGKSLR